MLVRFVYMSRCVTHDVRRRALVKFSLHASVLICRAETSFLLIEAVVLSCSCNCFFFCVLFTFSTTRIVNRRTENVHLASFTFFSESFELFDISRNAKRLGISHYHLFKWIS